MAISPFPRPFAGRAAFVREMLAIYGRVPRRFCACGAPLFARREFECERCWQAKRVRIAGAPRSRRAARIDEATQCVVLARDGLVCHHCKQSVRWASSPRDVASDVLVFDHYPIPVCQGGTGDASNVVVACRRCNSPQGGRMGGLLTQAVRRG